MAQTIVMGIHPVSIKRKRLEAIVTRDKITERGYGWDKVSSFTFSPPVPLPWSPASLRAYKHADERTRPDDLDDFEGGLYIKAEDLCAVVTTVLRKALPDYIRGNFYNSCSAVYLNETPKLWQPYYYDIGGFCLDSKERKNWAHDYFKYTHAVSGIEACLEVRVISPERLVPAIRNNGKTRPPTLRNAALTGHIKVTPSYLKRMSSSRYPFGIEPAVGTDDYGRFFIPDPTLPRMKEAFEKVC